jgi:hypothetical protein
MWHRQQAGLLSLIAALGACSVDEWRHPQRSDEAACLADGGQSILHKFCVYDASASSDAGHSSLDSGADAAQRDAGQSDRDAGNVEQDAGGMQPDAAQHGEPCTSQGATETCYTGANIDESQQLPCRAGLHTCENGFWGPCNGEVTPKADVCNGEDDDCDGKTDEGLSGQQCTVSDPSVKGACAMGIALCRKGNADCVRYVTPDVETCNGVDDDCDGTVDEDTGVKCYPAGTPGCTSDGMDGYTCKGACSTGVHACVSGQYATACTGSVTPQAAEVCTNSGADAVDENCNGQIDEGCTCNNGETAKCYTGTPSSTAGIGACKKGTRTCSAGSFGACVGDVTPQAESCANEGSDDDCNGIVDDVAMSGTSCADRSTATGVCKTHAVWGCSGGGPVCVDGTKSIEICDAAGEDENCDGQVNEGFNLQTDSNNCGACGMQCGAGSTCCMGHCVDTASSNANCGQCGNACAAGSACCSSLCTNIKTDSNNCGSCGRVCVLGCTNGTCNLL